MQFSTANTTNQPILQHTIGAMAGFRVSLLVFLTLLWLQPAANGQPSPLPDLKFRTYNTLDGLTDNSVVKIIQDKKGFLWMATHNGISRFDGLQFKNYTYSPNDSNSLRSIWITDMALDQQGTLWISTEWGICWYDETNDCFHYVNRRQQVQILYKGPLCTGANNTLWLAAEDGLKQINSSRKTFVHTGLTRIPDPQCIATDSQGNIWIGTKGNGVFIFEPGKNVSEHIFPACVPAKAHIMDIHREGNFLWMATSDGLLKVNTTTRKIQVNDRPASGGFINDNALMSISSFAALHGDSMLLCGTYDKRLLLFNKNTNQFVYQWQNNHTRLNDMPYGIYFDLFTSGNILWIGSDHGLSKLNMAQQDFTANTIPAFFNKGQNKTLIKNILPDKQQPSQYWINTAKPDSGIYSYNRTTGAISKISPYSYNSLLANERTGNIWACRKNAVEMFSNGKLQQQIRLPATAMSGYFDGKGQLWLATTTGAAVINTANNSYKVFNCDFNGTTIENHSFDEPFLALGVAMSPDGKLWLSSIKYGLFEFDTASKKFTPHRQPFNTAYEAKNRCSSVDIDSKGNIWVSNMAGISMYQPSKKTFTNYDRDSGLLSTYVYSIRFDKNGLLWGRGNTDIFSFDIEKRQFADYSLPQEMIPSFFGQLLSREGDKMLVGFEGGYASFSPLATTPAPASVHLSSCMVLGKRYAHDFDDGGTKPIFNHTENVISLAFTAVDYEQPEKINYAYKLEGFDKDWQNSGKRNTAFYTNLPPGHYRFWARARRDNGGWVSIPKSFDFYIQPAIWQRVWFWPVILLLAMAGIFIFFIKRIKDAQQKKIEKANISKLLAELEMKTLRSQMNPHFIFNSLNSVQKFIWENKKDDASDYLSKFARLIRMILEHSSQTNISLSEELAALKTYIELEHRRSNGRFEYSLRVAENVEAADIRVPPLLLQPFVENAIWHGLGPLQDRGGMLQITISRQQNWLVCIIRDNGIGRKKASELKAQSSLHRKSVGMEITRQRLSLLQKDGSNQILVEITDLCEQQNATGTEVIVRIPFVEDIGDGAATRR